LPGSLDTTAFVSVADIGNRKEMDMDDETLKKYYEIYTGFWQIFKWAVKSDKPVTEVYRQASIKADEIYHKHISLDESLILDLYRATIRAVVKIKEE
jgi:hypothetical protein